MIMVAMVDGQRMLFSLLPTMVALLIQAITHTLVLRVHAGSVAKNFYTNKPINC
jgi:hypothetical protein